jgi:SAM-dependent methyltransferase
MDSMDAPEFWDSEAAAFDEAPDHGLRDPAVRDAWARLLLPMLPSVPARVADLGCGTGTLTVLMAQAGHVVAGLDVSPRMVALARGKIAAGGVVADVVVGDASSPPWQPGTFDAVLTRHVLWAMPDPEAALTMWIDLLAPGGRLILIEGRWSTGVGLASADVAELVLRHRREAEVTLLDDPALWGGPIGDERYVITSPR